MTSEELIKQIQDEAGEWIEMSNDPWKVVCNVLASEVVELKAYIEYLERRLDNVPAR